MRYYSIQITDPTSGAAIRTYTSFVNGKTLPGALNIELDVPVTAFALPYGAAFVRVWGISLKDVAQASDLNGKSISVYAGMQAGLPLANPKQSGLIVQGTIQQAFGNWQGTNQTLDMQITVAQSIGDTPKNISFDWKAGTPLEAVITSTLATAFPGYTSSISISPNLILSHDEPGFYGSMVQFAQYVKQMSQSILGGSYRGVDIVLKEKTFTVYDGTTQTTPLQIGFNDLIGQVTWIASQLVQLSCVMRADLSVSDFIKMPPGQITTSSASLSQYRQGSVFQGVFQIQTIRHIGNFRQADAASWVTVIDAYPVTQNGQ